MRQPEAFDRRKIEQSVSLACRKRDVSQERIDQLVSGIQRQVETAGESEVTSSRIGELVMDGLRQLDSVAYIRFASVYRDFSEARDFEEFASAVQDVGSRTTLQMTMKVRDSNRQLSCWSVRNWARISAKLRGQCSISVSPKCGLSHRAMAGLTPSQDHRQPGPISSSIERKGV